MREMTSDEFDEILIRLVDEHSASNLLTIPGVYEIVAEYMNNDVIQVWEDEMDGKE